MTKQDSNPVILEDIEPPDPKQIFRVSTLGTTLMDALDEMVTNNILPANVAMRILSTFDEKMPDVLADGSLVKERLTFKGKLGKNYRKFNDFCSIDGENVTIKLQRGNTLEIDKLRIMAKEAKRSIKAR